MTYRVKVSFELTEVESESGKYEDVVSIAKTLVPGFSPDKMKYSVDKELPHIEASDSTSMRITLPDRRTFNLDFSKESPEVTEESSQDTE